jgi:hypothetical protein
MTDRVLCRTGIPRNDGDTGSSPCPSSRSSKPSPTSDSSASSTASNPNTDDRHSTTSPPAAHHAGAPNGRLDGWFTIPGEPLGCARGQLDRRVPAQHSRTRVSAHHVRPSLADHSQSSSGAVPGYRSRPRRPARVRLPKRHAGSQTAQTRVCPSDTWVTRTEEVLAKTGLTCGYGVVGDTGIEPVTSSV